MLLCLVPTLANREAGAGGNLCNKYTVPNPQDVLNTYCWIHSTYTIPSAFWKRIGFDVAHPGVDKTQDPLERRYHKYYQWVCFCLFFQVRSD